MDTGTGDVDDRGDGLSTTAEFPDLSGVILAGGRSRRMGQEKALLRYRGERLIALVHAVLAPLCGEVLVVAPDPEPYAFLGARGIRDSLPGTGPLIGIHAGLTASRNEWVCAVGCDMPLLQRPLLRYLAGLRRGFDVVIPRRTAGYEPLHALYSRPCLPVMAAAARSGDRRVSSFFAQVRVREVMTADLRRHDPDLTSLHSANTPAELAELERLGPPNAC